MGSPFDAAMAAADAAQAAVYGEPIRVVPRVAAPNRAPVADVSRTAAVITGIFTEAAAEISLEGSRRGAEGRGVTTFVAADAKVWFSRAQLAVLGWTPRKSDLIVLTERASTSFTVEKADPSDVGDVTVLLSRVNG